jgi:hypothetical protein
VFAPYTELEEASTKVPYVPAAAALEDVREVDQVALDVGVRVF